MDVKFLKEKLLDFDMLIKKNAGGFETDKLKICKFFIEDIVKKIQDAVFDVSLMWTENEIKKANN